MNGGQIIGLRRGGPVDDDISVADPETELLLDAPADNPGWDDDTYEEELQTASNWPGVARLGLILAALGWTGWFGWAASTVPPASPLEIGQYIGIWCVPMIALGVTAMLLLRNSRAEAKRFAATAGMLRAEAMLLEQHLGRLSAQLMAAHGELSAQAEMLQEMGARAAQRLQATSTTIADRAAAFETSATRAERAGDALGQRLAALDDAMPALEDRAASMAESMADDAAQLEARMETMAERVEALQLAAAEARGDISGTVKSLSAQLKDMREAAAGAGQELDGLGAIAASRIDTALARVEAALEATRKGTDAQGAALEALVERSSAALNAQAHEAVGSFGEHADGIAARLDTLEAMIGRQRDVAAELDTSLRDSVEEASERFAALETDGIDRNERLGAAMALLAAEAEKLESALAGGNGTAEALIGRSERLLLALDSGVREIDETLPLALARLDERLRETQALMATGAPEIEKMEAVADGLLGRVREAAELMDAHREAVSSLLDDSEAGLTTSTARLGEVAAALAAADEGTRRLSESAGPQLIEALIRVRETAEAAGEHARAAIGRAIPEAAQRLSEQAAQAMESAIADKVARQMSEIASIAENAVRAAHLATDRLMRQLLTITESSASLERRVAEAEFAAEERDRDNFARRSAMLIESLNSTAIDVTKMLSHDVSDASWAGYLKGDRGVFTRRAVRLLDAGETRAIATLYQDDAEFAEHVNRYIHDFEAMLRNMLSTRDGHALGVTLLSSDMGKLYVALAQATERLRD
jgi:hypothetical protein